MFKIYYTNDIGEAIALIEMGYKYHFEITKQRRSQVSFAFSEVSKSDIEIAKRSNTIKITNMYKDLLKDIKNFLAENT